MSLKKELNTHGPAAAVAGGGRQPRILHRNVTMREREREREKTLGEREILVQDNARRKSRGPLDFSSVSHHFKETSLST